MENFFYEFLTQMREYRSVTEDMVTYVSNDIGDYLQGTSWRYTNKYDELTNSTISNNGVRKQSYIPNVARKSNMIIPISLGQNDTSNSVLLKLSDAETNIPQNADGKDNPKMTPFLEACFLEYYPNVIAEIEANPNTNILLEAVVWYRPVSLSNETAAYYVYGTAANIAANNILNAKTLGQAC